MLQHDHYIELLDSDTFSADFSTTVMVSFNWDRVFFFSFLEFLLISQNLGAAGNVIQNLKKRKALP